MTKRIPVPGKDTLCRLYFEDRKTMIEIGRVFGTSQTTVCKWMLEYGIKERTMSEALLRGKRRPTDQELYDMYITNHLSATDIGKRFGVASHTIRSWIKTAGIESKYVMNRRLQDNIRPTDDELSAMYVLEMRPVSHIAEVFGVSNAVIKAWLHSAEIQIRTRAKERISAEDLNMMYVDNNLSAQEIAVSYGVSYPTMLAWLEDAGIQRRPAPGITCCAKSEYCSMWNEDLREFIRDRYGRKCVICGKTEVDNGAKLSVHHTNSGKMCMCEYSCELVPLCRSCHGKTVHNRFYWYSFIMRKLLLEPSAQFINMDIQC